MSIGADIGRRSNVENEAPVCCPWREIASLRLARLHKQRRAQRLDEARRDNIDGLFRSADPAPQVLNVNGHDFSHSVTTLTRRYGFDSGALQ
jgi:hypothetical protein